MARHLGICIVFIGLTVAMTWPQAGHLGTHVHNSDDPLLSIWRLSWIAHILPNSPRDLLNGNIFHPEPRTLAYTDAVILQGLVAAPFIWAGLSPVAVYNVLNLLSIALSGWAMWWYAARLTGSAMAGIVAGIAYAFVPYRFDHFMHLELQATFFVPLALLALERLLDSHSRRDATLLAGAFVGQVYAGIYYAVFLGTALLVIVPLRLRALDRQARTAVITACVLPAVVAVLIVAPYAAAYVSNRSTLGDRHEGEIALYSATWHNYLAATPDNEVHGEWSGALGRSERRLFPGVIATALAIVGVVAARRGRLTPMVAGLIGFVISLGLNTPLYDLLRTIVLPYRGLRAPARASILVFLAIAALAAAGHARVLRGRSSFSVAVATTAVAAAMLFEYRTAMQSWLTLPTSPPQVYRWLAAQPRSVVVEIPLPMVDQFDRIFDGLYMFNSAYHWQPMLNGYSGFYPRSFIELVTEAEGFPDERSIAYLKRRGVDLIVVHGVFLGAKRYGEVTNALLARPDVEATAQFDEPSGSDMVFRLRR